MTAPSAVGTLAETPLAHALIYARNRRLSGRLELTAPDAKRAMITIWRGRLIALESTPEITGADLGTILYGLGYSGAITVAQRDEALVEQLHRKVHHLFAWPATSRYAFYDTPTTPENASFAVDLVGPIWRGIRDFPPTKFVSETLRRVGEHALRRTEDASARLPAAEMALAETLAMRPMTVAQMKAATQLPAAQVELLVYLLVIAKCVEAVSGARAHPSTGPLPAAMPSGPMAAVRPSLGAMPVQSIRPSGIVPTVPPDPRMSIPPARSSTPSYLPAQRSIPPTPISSSKFPAQRSASIMPSATRWSSAPPPIQTPAELGAQGIVERAATIENTDYFSVLGLADNASAETVRAAYIRLAKSWHPDRVSADLQGVRNEIAKIFSQMTRAQQTLCDESARKGYLATKNAKPKARPRADVMREIEHATKRNDALFVVQLCQELIDHDPEDAEAVARQAWASVSFGEANETDLRAALSKMERAVNMDRTDDQAVYHRGLVQKRLDNGPAAFRDFSRALQLNPKHVDAEREVRIFAMRARRDGNRSAAK